MLGAGLVVYAVVVVALLVALPRRRGQADQREPRYALIVGGVVLPAIVVTAVFVLSARPDGPLFAMTGRAAFPIEVVGHQWWWSVRYPEQGIVTANEIHVPVGVPVELRLRSADVVHSFWVPQLNGKTDLLPDQLNALPIEAQEPGVYRGECAEFCGVQHAKMQALVVAEPPERFDAWVARMREPASEPLGRVAEHGQRAFFRTGCAVCHRIAGTGADGMVGPDLTHVGSRLTLGAAAVPNTRGHLGGWVVNSQSIKPGNKMPPQKVSADDLPALLTYLEGLE
jgi:cytochrome c oxidase subunit 2